MLDIATLFACRGRRTITALLHTRPIGTVLFALRFVGATDLLAGTFRGALLQGVSKRFHFAGEALDLTTEFLDTGIVGLTSSLGTAGRIRAGVGDALRRGERITAFASALLGPLRMMAMVLLSFSPADIAACCGAGGIHTASFSDVWTWSASFATVISETALSDGMLKTLRHVTQPCFAQMSEGLADMRVALWCR